MVYRKARKPVYRRKRKAMRMRKARQVKNSLLLRRNGIIMRITQTGLNTVTTSGSDGNGSLFITTPAGDSMTNTIQWGNSFLFKLSSASETSDLVNLFDRYKINAVRLKVMYQADSASVGGAGVMPIFNYCHDYDDASLPSSLNNVTVKAAARSVVLSANKPVSIYIKPKVASFLYQTVTAGVPIPGFGVQKAPFINSTYPDVQHYGLKTWINNFYAPTGANNQITIQPTYYLSLRDPQ